MDTIRYYFRMTVRYARTYAKLLTVLFVVLLLAGIAAVVGYVLGAFHSAADLAARSCKLHHYHFFHITPYLLLHAIPHPPYLCITMFQSRLKLLESWSRCSGPNSLMTYPCVRVLGRVHLAIITWSRLSFIFTLINWQSEPGHSHTLGSLFCCCCMQVCRMLFLVHCPLVIAYYGWRDCEANSRDLDGSADSTTSYPWNSCLSCSRRANHPHRHSHRLPIELPVHPSTGAGLVYRDSPIRELHFWNSSNADNHFHDPVELAKCRHRRAPDQD
jgi:hypothetical protein